MANDFSDRTSWYSFFERYRTLTGREPPEEATPQMHRPVADLKRCPLCGHSVAKTFDLYRKMDTNIWWVSADCSCGISFDSEVEAETEEDARRIAVSRWNRRSRQ